MKKQFGNIVFDPSKQPGYSSRVNGINSDRYKGDFVFGTVQPSKAPVDVDLPQGLKSFQLPQVFPSRRRMKGGK